MIYGTVGICSTIAIHNIVPLCFLINVRGRCEVGDIFVSDQSDHRWGGVLYLDRQGDRDRRVSTAVGISVCDQIDSRYL